MKTLFPRHIAIVILGLGVVSCANPHFAFYSPGSSQPHLPEKELEIELDQDPPVLFDTLSNTATTSPKSSINLLDELKNSQNSLCPWVSPSVSHLFPCRSMDPFPPQPQPQDPTVSHSNQFDASPDELNRLHEELMKIDPKNFRYMGWVKPTTYYIPVVSTAKACKSYARLWDLTARQAIPLCQSDRNECLLQGTCLVQFKNEEILYNFSDFIKGLPAFQRVNREKCPYGYGIKNICLDPFYTLAADTRILKAGTVIFIPKVRGLQLPNGRQHHGFFIVRDIGEAIKGYGRKDFFSGFFHWRNPQNPFHKIGLHNPNQRVEFYQVPPSIAELVRKARAYPLIPESLPANGASAP